MKNVDIDIDYVASLARIELTDKEKENLSSQLNDILGYFKKLEQVDVEGIAPIAHAFPVYNVLDEDISSESLDIDLVLLNAPAKRDNQIIVPKIVEEA